MGAAQHPSPREGAFRDLYEATYHDLLRFAQRRVDPANAEDVVADTMLVMWRRFHEVPADPGDARAWLYGIARNTLLNARRGGRRKHALTMRVAGARSPSISGDDAELAAHRLDVAQAFQSLSPAYQEALALTAWEGLTSPQAAQVLGISPVAYRLRLSRARRALRARLDHPPASADRTADGLAERSHP
jgi:RNA polymerase sigma-70 factor (ECF subfamily)